MTGAIDRRARGLRDGLLRCVVLAGAVLAAHCADGAPTSPTAASPARFNLTGSVQDTALQPLSGVSVEIVGGPLANQIAITNAEGQFTFADLAPLVESVGLTATKDGYEPATTVARNNGRAVVWLTASRLIPLEGEYTVAFTAANACAGVPPTLRQRVYQATVRRHANVPAAPGTRMAITLSGARFYFGYDTLGAWVSNDAVRLAVYSQYAFDRWLDDQPIVERIDATSYLAWMGTATALNAQIETPMSASLNGTVSFCASAQEPVAADFPPTCAVAVIECRSTEHRVSLVRR